MGKQIYLTEKDIERLYHHLQNHLESGDLSEEDCEWYYKLIGKLRK